MATQLRSTRVPDRVVVNRLYLPTDLHTRLEAIAAAEERTLSNQIVWFLRRALERAEDTAS